MDDTTLTALFKDLESDRVERKSSPADAKKIRQAICAFANDLPNHQAPGVLFIGVHDDGTCAHLAITDQLLLDLTNIRAEGKILPFPVLQVNKRMIEGCELVVIIVEPSDTPPVRFDGRTYIRVGPSRATATPAEERRLNEKRRARDLPFDLHPFPSASLEDLDLDLFQQKYLPAAVAPEVLAENERSILQQLTSLRCITVGSNSQPTTLGILVIGKNPTQFIPGFYIQFVRFDGTELTDPIRDQKEIKGTLIDLLRYTDEVLQANIATATNISAQPIEVKKPDYPIVALQQLLRNAVMHRSYEQTHAPIRIYWFNDRIEIHNPGGLFGQVDRQNFGQGITDYRNPHLAEAMKTLGYVQRFGIGIPTAQKELQKNGNPPPEFILADAHTLVILRKET
jgi:ATP-dependent DNA helicase RecG